MTDESLKLHNSKTILTKEEFFDLNASAAQEMSQDGSLQMQAKDVLITADQHRWLHMNTWMGEPVQRISESYSID